MDLAECTEEGEKTMWENFLIETERRPAYNYISWSKATGRWEGTSGWKLKSDYEAGLRFICIAYHKCLHFTAEENANKFILI